MFGFPSKRKIESEMASWLAHPNEFGVAPKSVRHKRPALTTSRRKAPALLVLCSICLLLAGLAFLATGLLFLIAPESLRDAGFGQDATVGRKVLGLLMFGGVGALFAWPAWGLIRLNPFAFQIARGLALAIAGLSVTRIVGGDASPAFDWPVVVIGLAMAGYLSLPSVRALFRPNSG